MANNINKSSHMRLKDQLHRYDHDEGFSQDQAEAMIIQQQQIQQFSSCNIVKFKAKPRFNQPKIKLTFMGRQKTPRSKLKDNITKKQNDSDNRNYKSLQIRKKDLKAKETINLHPTTVKTKRMIIGQNIIAKDYLSSEIKGIKKYIVNKGGQIIFQKKFQSNTHSVLRYLNEQHNMQQQKNYSFVKSKYNNLLKQKLKQSFIMPKKKIQLIQLNTSLRFYSGFQSANLELSAKVGLHQYNLYMSVDTNTYGHQNWFYFRVENVTDDSITALLNICNFKRQLKMFNKGVKIFYRNLTINGQWETGGENISMKENMNPLTQHKAYKLSFQFCFKPNQIYQLSLLPPYTYSKLLQQLQIIEKIPQVKIETLTYSLMGLAIPLITVSKQSCNQKNVILISGRIHPGETVGSLIIQGIFDKIKQRNKDLLDFLQQNIIKIIPMINPDGVILGNFRTYYLGNDLNRSFGSNDEIINPQICALKQLGKMLKQQYENKFIMFLDLHGHSSKKNIFCYGPHFQPGHNLYYQSRILPKILHTKSNFFNYSSSSFKLQQYKKNTARGYFLNQIDIISYTFEASYSSYDFQNKQIQFRYKDWVKFGYQLLDGIIAAMRLMKISKFRTHGQLKRAINSSHEQDLIMIKKITKDIKKQSVNIAIQRENQILSDSDGESDGQDLPLEQRQQIEKKLIQTQIPHFILPKVTKPAILYPIVTPRLFQLHQKQQQNSIKLLYTKRNKYSGIKMMNISATSTNLSADLQKLDFLKSHGKNIKLEKRVIF